MRIVEVGPRDGLQTAARPVEPEVRAELVRRSLAAGVAEVEAVSFVRADLVPNMAGAAEVVHAAGADAAMTGLVINSRGLQDAAAAGLRRVRVLALTTDTFSRRNSNVGAEEGLVRALELVAEAHAQGIAATAIVGAAFGCPFEGDVDPGRPVRMAERFAAAGAVGVVFADTIGVATPREVRRVVGRVRDIGVEIGGHFHNTRNTGYANALAAVEEGATILDASTGGLGGCPFAPAATGNIATEDLVYLLEGEGFPTGVDLVAAIDVARWFAAQTGLTGPSMLPRAGVRPTGAPVDASPGVVVERA